MHPPPVSGDGVRVSIDMGREHPYQGVAMDQQALIPNVANSHVPEAMFHSTTFRLQVLYRSRW